jgi:iron complex outermembrane receptor protein
MFGSLEYDVPWIEGLSASFGVRYIKEKKEFSTRFLTIANSTLVGSTFVSPSILELNGQKGEWDDVVFEAGVGYQVTEDINTYYRFAQGFRSGGFSIRGSQPSPTPSDPRSWSLTFNPEHVNSHEVGVKSTWFDSRLVANLAGFFNIIDGAQGSSIINGVSAVGTDTLILNGGKTEIYGVELQSSLEVLEGLNVDFTLGWQAGEGKGSVQSSHNLPAPAGDTVCNAIPDPLGPPGTPLIPKANQNESTCPTIAFASGSDLARTPELSWSIGTSYRRSLGAGELVLGSRVRHTDFFWIIPRAIDPNTGAVINTPVPQSGYSLLDANISYEFQVNEHSVRFGFVGRNLTDKQYKEQELPLGPGGFRGWGPPRYVGGELEIEL